MQANQELYLSPVVIQMMMTKTLPTSQDLPVHHSTSSLETCLVPIETSSVETQTEPYYTPSQTPIPCIRNEDGCRNVIYSYFNKYTAISVSCSRFLYDKLQATPYPHSLCLCYHNPSEGKPLSFCTECMDDLHQDGWIETGRGSWHLDRNNGNIVCISLDFIDPPYVPISTLNAVHS